MMTLRDLINKLLGRETASANTARERLQLVLAHDRVDMSSLTTDLLDKMRKEILDVVAKSPVPGVVVVPEPLFRAAGGAAPPIAKEVHEEFCSRMLAQIRTATDRCGRLDAIFLALHGAACAEHHDDPEGDLLGRVRAMVGDEVPIAVSLDHHANITKAMTSHADLLIGHQTQPHDPPDTGRKAAQLLLDWLAAANGNPVLNKPNLRWRKIPMMTQQDQYLTSPAGPMKEWFDKARSLEQHPDVLDVSPYPTQPWLDVGACV